MAATFSFVEYNATAGDTGVPTNLNLGSTNAKDLAPSTYPITAGTYSYSKWIRGHFSGTFTRIENLKFYCSNSGTGYVSEEVINFSGTTSDYAGTSTYATPTNAADAQASNALVFSEPGTANIGIGGSLSGSLESEGDSDFIVVQASIGSGASAGAVQQKTLTFVYDEI